MSSNDGSIARLREICLALPGATERVSHGEIAFFVGKQFLTVDDHHHGADHLAFWCPAPPGAQATLIGRDAARFFRPPYVGHRGWIGVRMDAGLDWDEAELIIRDAFRHVAPKRLLAELDRTI